MGRKLKSERYALVLKNGRNIYSINELKENCEIEELIELFLTGKLENWVSSQNITDVTIENKLKTIDKESDGFEETLAEIFNVRYDLNQISDTHLKVRRKREIIRLLEQYEIKDEFLDKMENIALSQQELDMLISKQIDMVYLLGKEFKLVSVDFPIIIKGLNQPMLFIDESLITKIKRGFIKMDGVMVDETTQKALEVRLNYYCKIGENINLTSDDLANEIYKHHWNNTMFGGYKYEIHSFGSCVVIFYTSVRRMFSESGYSDFAIYDTVQKKEVIGMEDISKAIYLCNYKNIRIFPQIKDHYLYMYLQHDREYNGRLVQIDLKLFEVKLIHQFSLPTNLAPGWIKNIDIGEVLTIHYTDIAGSVIRIFDWPKIGKMKADRMNVSSGDLAWSTYLYNGVVYQTCPMRLRLISSTNMMDGAEFLNAEGKKVIFGSFIVYDEVVVGLYARKAYEGSKLYCSAADIDEICIFSVHGGQPLAIIKECSNVTKVKHYHGCIVALMNNGTISYYDDKTFEHLSSFNIFERCKIQKGNIEDFFVDENENKAFALVVDDDKQINRLIILEEGI